MYDNVKISMPEVNQVISAKYTGYNEDYYLLSVPGYKDDIRIENRPSESKYLKNSAIGDMIDVLIANIDQDIFLIKGSVSSLYESRAHANLKSLSEGQSVTITVKNLNPAGYDVELNHGGVTLPGFMPNTLAGINKLHNTSSIVGESFNVCGAAKAQRIIGFDQPRKDE